MQVSEEENYYDILGVSRTAKVDEIKVAYKEIAKAYHPDSNFYSEIVQEKGDGSEDKKFKLLTQAYTILTNEARRKEYDDSLAPNLPGWDTNSSEQFHQDMIRRSSSAYQPTTSGAMGVFGKVKNQPHYHEVEPEIDKSMDTVRIAVRRRKGLFSRFWYMLGL